MLLAWLAWQMHCGRKISTRQATAHTRNTLDETRMNALVPGPGRQKLSLGVITQVGQYCFNGINQVLFVYPEIHLLAFLAAFKHTRLAKNL
jgi:hypothetical protein